eukprot:6726-Chlamydomonas_euryale.AAC.2
MVPQAVCDGLTGIGWFDWSPMVWLVSGGLTGLRCLTSVEWLDWSGMAWQVSDSLTGLQWPNRSPMA